MQIHKLFTTIALLTLGNITIIQTTPKQQRDYMDSLSASTPASSEFSDLVAETSESPAKIQRLLKSHNNVSAMAANSQAWYKANRSTLTGPANSATVSASNQLKAEQNALHGKIRKIHDAHKLMLKNIEQAYKIIKDNSAEREGRLTTAFSEINQSMIPTHKLEKTRKKEVQPTSPAPKKSKKIATNDKKSEKNKKVKSSKKDNPEKKDAKPKKEKKSKKNKQHNDDNEIAEVRYW